MVELERTEALRPAAEGARLVALRQLDEARAALVRVGDVEDDEAIHDVRVALRRLRSSLAAYRALLDEGAALRGLTRAGKLRLERARAIEGLGDAFEELEAELRASLSTYAAPVTPARAPPAPTFALAAGDALRTASAELERALAAVAG